MMSGPGRARFPTPQETKWVSKWVPQQEQEWQTPILLLQLIWANAKRMPQMWSCWSSNGRCQDNPYQNGAFAVKNTLHIAYGQVQSVRLHLN
jgi:hypothetical protein